MYIKNYFCIAALTLISSSQIVVSTVAQVRSDNTLPINSRIQRKGSVIKINGGTLKKRNLFHSFLDFSINNSETIIFNNDSSIKNIFARITGNSISDVDGLIQATGAANLFLINPNGIIFQKNAKLNIGGSFISTTASSIHFSNGSTFAHDPSYDNLFLASDEPSFFSFDTSSGPIIVNGYGSKLQFFNKNSPINSPIIGGGAGVTGLKTKPQKTLALIGGDIIFNDGVITSLSGNTEISSIKSGNVYINDIKYGLNYDHVNTFGDIKITGRSLIDSSGIYNGSINLRGENLFLNKSSLILNSNYGNFDSGDINIDVLDSVVIDGQKDLSFLDNPFGVISGIVSQTFSNSTGADIYINSKNFRLENFMAIRSLTASHGKGGDIFINSRDINIDGFPVVQNQFTGSNINALTVSDGNAGNIFISGNNLSLTNGGLVVSQSFGNGDSGNIDIRFENTILLNGGFFVSTNKDSYLPSLISTSSFLFGDAGSINLTGRSLSLLNGAQISAITTGSGDAGNIVIDTKSTFIDGFFSSNKFPDFSSQIKTSAQLPLSFFYSLFTPPPLTGNAGLIIINSEFLSIKNSGVISAFNIGDGDAGTLKIDASNIYLLDSKILSNTSGGDGGNIELTTNTLTLKNSQIDSSAGGKGDGGSTTINADFVAGDPKSIIRANAEKGKGGDINIFTEGLIFSSENITASSSKGVSGQVKVISENKFKSISRNLTVNPIDSISPVTCQPDKGFYFLVSPDHINDSLLEDIVKSPEYPKFRDDTNGGKITPLIKSKLVNVGNGMVRAMAMLPVSSQSPELNESLCKAQEASMGEISQGKNLVIKKTK